jgi:hypothetical protein
MKTGFTSIGSRCIACAVLMLTAAGCVPEEQGDTFTDESVRQAARHYYTLYTRGDARQFVKGMAGSESFAEDYREQMRNVVAQAAKGLERKGGVVRVEAISDTLYVADSTAYVYLDLVFADSVHEQIGVPMAFIGGYWKMK